MRIQSLNLKNFKRFTDVTLRGIPANAKLVLLIGSNGSGKSSVFDAFEQFGNNAGKSMKDSGLTLRKNIGAPEALQLQTFDHGSGGFSDSSWAWIGSIKGSNFYGRTSFRQISRLRRKNLGNEFDVQTDSDRPASFIDRDDRLENDLEHIFGKLLREYFISRDRGEVHDQVIVPLNNAFEKIFKTKNGTTLSIAELIPPLDGKRQRLISKKANLYFTIII